MLYRLTGVASSRTILTMGHIRTHARSPEQKQRRRIQMIDAARQLEELAGFNALAVAQVARLAGVAKGTVFLYFPTKEALGLALLELLLTEWFTDLEEAPIAPDARSLARRIASSVDSRPALVRMLALQGSLESNVEVAHLHTFKWNVLEAMRSAGRAMEKGLPALSPGDGFRLIQFVQVLVTGLQPLAAARSTLSAPELAPLRIDFAGALESALRVHLEGLRALRRT
jgi:AcrR family transcriptional regulator